MPDLTASALAGFSGALVLLAGYHFLVAGPRLGRGTRDAGKHDDRPGSAGAKAERKLAALAGRIATVETVVHGKTPLIGFVRYNAFDDVGSDQSYALAVLTRDGDGVVLSSIYSREETRTYGKAVRKFKTPNEASAEERGAIEAAKAGAP